LVGYLKAPAAQSGLLLPAPPFVPFGFAFCRHLPYLTAAVSLAHLRHASCIEKNFFGSPACFKTQGYFLLGRSRRSGEGSYRGLLRHLLGSAQRGDALYFF
jgi:hypothetical protein